MLNRQRIYVAWQLVIITTITIITIYYYNYLYMRRKLADSYVP